MNLGENTYKRKNDRERRRRIVIGVEAEVERSMEWRPYRNLPIAPGLPDLGRPTRSTCEDVGNEDLGIHFDLVPIDPPEGPRELGGRPTRSTCEDLGNEDLGIHFDLVPIDPPEELPEGYELGGRPTRSTCEYLWNEDLGIHFDMRG